MSTVQPVIDRMLDDETLDILTGGVGIDLFAGHRLDRIIDRTSADIPVRL